MNHNISSSWSRRIHVIAEELEKTKHENLVSTIVKVNGILNQIGVDTKILRI